MQAPVGCHLSRPRVQIGCEHDLHSGGRPVRLDEISAHRAQRPQTAGNLARPVAQLRTRTTFTTQRDICRRAFDLGVTHFDLANNYGPPYGSAEENFGRILADDLGPYRDELIISTKAGYDMWPGPYGEWGSRKYLLASLDQSLRPDGAGLRRHLLLAPAGSGHAARGDDGRAGRGRTVGQGALRRASPTTPRSRPRGRRDPARARHPAAHPPADVLDVQPVDRAPAARRAGPRSGPAASRSRRSPRACSPTGTWTGSRPTRAMRTSRFLDETDLTRRAAGHDPGPQRGRRPARAVAGPARPGSGRCATRG